MCVCVCHVRLIQKALPAVSGNVGERGFINSPARFVVGSAHELNIMLQAVRGLRGIFFKNARACKQWSLYVEVEGLLTVVARVDPLDKNSWH